MWRLIRVVRCNFMHTFAPPPSTFPSPRIATCSTVLSARRPIHQLKSIYKCQNPPKLNQNKTWGISGSVNECMGWKCARFIQWIVWCDGFEMKAHRIMTGNLSGNLWFFVIMSHNVEMSHGKCRWCWWIFFLSFWLSLVRFPFWWV